jgi:hypothetical protein
MDHRSKTSGDVDAGPGLVVDMICVVRSIEVVMSSEQCRQRLLLSRLDAMLRRLEQVHERQRSQGRMLEERHGADRTAERPLDAEADDDLGRSVGTRPRLGFADDRAERRDPSATP